MSKIKDLKEVISAATGEIMADKSIFGNIFNIYTGETQPGFISIKNGRIACITDKKPRAKKHFDFKNKYVLPGFIDGHIHIESSMMVPSVFSKQVIIHGTTTVVCDPHEIANVYGRKGIEFMINDSKNTPMNFYFMIPSCVPSSKFETTGAKIGKKDIEYLKRFKEIIGLAEFMDFPALISHDNNAVEKILSVENMIIDGHAPSLTGRKLCGYISAGIRSDHECTSAKEAYEKMKKGMHIMIREGSAAKNLNAIAKIVDDKNERRFSLVTDDINVSDLLKKGHLDELLRKAVQTGLTPLQAIRMVTLNPAEYLKIDQDIGAIAPGKQADIVIVNNLKDFKVTHTFIKGELISEKNKLKIKIKPKANGEFRASVKLKELHPHELEIKATRDCKVRIIKAFDHSLYTEMFEKTMRPENGVLKTDLKNDILKICVVERHKKTGAMGVGFVNGFGFKKGAVASTIAHDSHNVICVGTNDEDMIKAINHLKETGGGVVYVKNRKITATINLPVAGLMTDQPAEILDKKMREIHENLRNEGGTLQSPIATLSFLALPVIPRLKITDKGLIDVEKTKIVKLKT